MSKIKFGVVVFPGSNCDHDAYYVVKKTLSNDAEFLWHKEPDLKNCDAIILPGGFSYGDYLRTGSIARFSPIMNLIIDFAENGGIVIGICNGFQILLEAGLLPGVMLKNESLKFICKDVTLSVERKDTIFTNNISSETITVPIAHAEGNYFAEDDVLNELESNNQVIFRYCSKDGVVDQKFNPNGSKNNIAGIINRSGNVLGMMPHPERCADNVLRKTDGIGIFQSVIDSLVKI